MERKKVKGRNAGVGDDSKDLGPSSVEDTDSHTVFVRSLPFSLTDSQLEDIFSEIGPVRHCFTIKEKGSDQHRGFGFVHFAVTEDAQRAVQEKNGALVQGRKIKVELAKRRAPLDQRRPPNPDPSNAESTGSDQQQTSNPDGVKTEPKKRKSSELPTSPGVEKSSAEQRESKKIKPDGKVIDKVQQAVGKKEEESVPGGKQKESKERRNRIPDVPSQLSLRAEETKDQQEVHGSEKQRPARTVVIGNLLNTEMLEAVLAVAKTVGPVESVQRTMSEHELHSRGLAKDGCKPRAAAIVFLSVKVAMQAVAALHTKSFGGSAVWARQLGGEGSKLKKWRLIVRNLPFQVTETEVRDLFSSIGFLWEVSVPRKPDGMSKGFAFVGYTTKSDAEKAIKAVNGTKVGKRPVAVDWALGKNQYETAVSAAKSPGPEAVSSVLEGSDMTASDVSEDEEDPEDAFEASSDEEEQRADANTESKKMKRLGEEMVKEGPLEEKSEKKKLAREEAALKEVSDQKIIATEKNRKKGKLAREQADDQTPPLDEKTNDKRTRVEHLDIDQEMDMVKKILNKVVCSTQKPAEHSAVSDDDDEGEKPAVSLEREGPKKKAPEPMVSNGKLGSAGKTLDPGALAKDADDNAIGRTLFIRNLPMDAESRELRKLFSDFGVVKSFRMVLHPVTSRPKGTAFLEYATKQAADSAIAAASTSGEGRTGLMIKGRQISVTSAVDRDTARNMAKNASIAKEQEDRRNLALAKEGLIQETTPAAEGVSKKDMEKRKMLEREKATKLRSPNFHISRTRLSVHNVPKGLTEKALKKLFIEAVKSRASKQNPVIKQVKILRDDVTGKARGTAFVEFTEHQHALVALRVLNNNPATFTPDNRPIVEFAVENSLILRKRAVQLERQKKFQALKDNENVDTVGGKEETALKQKKGKKSRGSEADRKDDEQMHGEETPTKSGRMKKEKKKREKRPAELESVLEGEKTGRKRMREKQEKGFKNKMGRAKEAGEKKLTGPVDGKKDLLSAKVRTFGSVEVKQTTNQGRKAKDEAVKQHGAKENHSEDNASLREKKRRKKLSKVEAAEDRLDKLVNEYRTKYFSVGPATGSKTKDAGAAAVTDLRRWFQ
ncbi:hypothetical protein R1flu_024591 [Riccia fluitans]|uniref:RRM domain-containing protein n=1 Tax=Riccia fluitans TaxID=41844 RepID=A0ABD1XVS5_9MARC